jgi:acyl-CoA thioester hydrolase
MSRPEPPSRASFAYFAPVTLRWNDCDIQGHVNNSVPFQLFDTVVSFWQIENKLFHSPDQPICVVARQACNFFAEIGMMDRVVIGLALERLGSSSIAYALGLFVNDDDTAAVQGEFVHVVVDFATRNATPVPEFARRALLTLAPHGNVAPQN